MTYKLFLDDLRAPPDQTWVVARSVASAIEYVRAYGLPREMSLDHDLGDGCDAPAFLYWIIDRDIEQDHERQYAGGNQPGLENIKFNVHSANPAGRQNLEGLWSSYMKFLEHEAIRAERCKAIDLDFLDI